MSDIFVSYKRENLAAVGRLVEALRAEGVGVWWDQDIPPNAPWEATIETALAAAKLVIVAWSPASVASENVKAEARWARTQGRLVQVFVEACEPPLFFGERQGVDLKGWSGAATDPAFRTLVKAVRAGPASPAAEMSTTSDTPLALPGKPSIAILPFANLSGDPEQDYFADGMVEEIARALSRFKTMFVIGGASSLALKDKDATPQEAAKILGVRYVLEGSVRKAANRVRIAVKLIDGADGAQIWTERFEDTLEDVFALQDKVALGVAGVVGSAVTEAEVRRAAARPTQNVTSYDLFLRGLVRARSASKANVLAMLEIANRALALDPDFGWALVLALNAHLLIVVYGWSEDIASHAAQGAALAQRALQVAGDDAEILANVSTSFSVFGGDREAMSVLADRALVLNPGSAIVWYAVGFARLVPGQSRPAVEALETALRLDPFSPYRSSFLAFLGAAHFVGGRFDEAAPPLREAARHNPDWPLPWAFLAASLGHLGDAPAAREAIARHTALTPIEIRDWAVTWGPELQALIVEGVERAESGR
jgi:adenylate cyclase